MDDAVAPNIVEAIMNAWRAAVMTLAALLRPFPVTWAEQTDAISCSP